MALNPVWTPPTERINAARLTAFMQRLESSFDARFEGDYFRLHRWTIDNPGDFWQAVWRFTDVKGDPGSTVLQDGDQFPGAKWFPEARLNFAENLLRHQGEETALISLLENGERKTLSRNALIAEVAAMAAHFKDLGIAPGDRVAGYMPNIIETVVAMLATTAVGATWSSCSPDFGINGVLDRFGQITPRILITADGYYYNNKVVDSLSKARSIAGSIHSLERVIVVPLVNTHPDLTGFPGVTLWGDWDKSLKVAPIFERAGFNHPLYIMYSSGTTGAPKCILHGAGGTLLQHLKEHQLQVDLADKDTLFYFTTCGWMMWNWLVSGLASGSTLVLYDGSPFAGDGQVLLNAIDNEQITVFGTSAKYIAALEKTGQVPRLSHDLTSLKTILSTGSPLVHENFDYVYRGIKSDVCLSSISGGTDIISCFVGGSPILPVHRGEIQAPGLGMDVDIWNEAGKSVTGEKGELVCRTPFPSCPVGFWQDDSGSKFHDAYFAHWPGVWAHGDYGEHCESGGYIIHGRSDAVLNPGGVRIGTAEIYRQVEKVDEVVESIVIGQEWNDDVRVVLFVVLQDGLTLNEMLTERIRQSVRDNATPRHVPARVVQVTDIPRTISGKIVELAVRDVVHNRPVNNTDALANPEALALFRDLPELQN
jgi:acetoacetyl-CoA synthetase